MFILVLNFFTGYGVFAKKVFEANEFLLDYVGDLLTEEEGLKREKAYACSSKTSFPRCCVLLSAQLQSMVVSRVYDFDLIIEYHGKYNQISPKACSEQNVVVSRSFLAIEY